MKQISFSQMEFAGKKRTTRRELFLAEMEQVMPWSEVLGVIEPHYPKGKRGRPPGQLLRKLESVKASNRSKVEHPFHIVKNLFHFREDHVTGRCTQWWRQHSYRFLF